MATRTIPTQGSLDNPTLTIKIDGTAISNSIGVMDMMVHREFNRIPFARFKLVDGTADDRGFPLSSSSDFEPGKEVEIMAGYSFQENTIFKGIITRHRVRVDGSRSFLEIEARDKAVAMTLVETDRFFRESSDADAWETIISEYSLESDITGGKVEYPELVQYRVSDWDFIVSRAEANGKLVWVDDGKIYITAPEDPEEALLSLALGANLISFDGEVDAMALTPSVKATAWDPATQEVNEADAAEPVFSPNGNFEAEKLAESLSQPDEIIKLDDPLGAEALQALADSRLLRQRLAMVRGTLSCVGFDTLKPASWLELEGLGDRMNGDIYVTAVRHEFNAGRWIAQVQFGLDATWFAEKIGAVASNANSARITSTQGLSVGIVTALSDDPLGEGRVQVKLPTVDAEGEGLWARLGSIAAGADHGTFFQPEIGDEVVVGFLDGEANSPVILGALYNGTNPPAITASDDNFEQQILTKTGLKIYFNDEKKAVSIETPGGHLLSLDDDAGECILSDSNGNEITLSSDGINLKSAKDLIIDAKGDVTIGGVNITASAQAQAKLEGNAGAELSTSAVAVLKGSLVQIN
ncbi:MAG: type VI secretion system tip protein VgrG [Bacteroidia bacterium]